MEHVPEDQFAVVVERPGREEPRHIRPENLDAVPPAPHSLGIVLDCGDVRQRQFQAAAKRPELVQALDGKGRAVTFNGGIDHAGLLSLSGSGPIVRAVRQPDSMSRRIDSAQSTACSRWSKRWPIRRSSGASMICASMPHLPRSSSSARKNLWFAWNSNSSSRGGRCGGGDGGASPTDMPEILAHV